MNKRRLAPEGASLGALFGPQSRPLWYAERQLIAQIEAAPPQARPALRAELAAVQARFDAQHAHEFAPEPPRPRPSRSTRPTVIVGMPAPSGRLREQSPKGVPILISANALWDRRRLRFRLPDPPPYYDQCLDSAGFVAMVRYKGYPWSVDEYIDFAAPLPWIWYAAMDYCCEPDVAANHAEVTKRVHLTAATLQECRDRVRWLQEIEGIHWAADPMPVLQGWRPGDYKRSAELTNEVLRGDWPSVVGLGSVCRRQLKGPDGIYALLGHLDAILPPHVQLHLFGVKSGALQRLADHPRLCSIDSCAWDFAARVEARKTGAAKSIAYRGKFLRDWYDRQQQAIATGLRSAAQQPKLI